MRLLANVVLVVAIVIACFGLIFITDGFQSREVLPWTLAILSVVVPIGIAIWVWRLATNEGKPVFEQALGSFRADEKQWFMGSGIAIDKAGKRLLLADTQGTRIVDFSDLREHRFVQNRSGGGSVGGTGPLALLSAAIKVADGVNQYNTAGLHVVVGGPGQMQWRMIGISNRDGQRWSNLLDEARFAAKAQPA